MFMFKIADAGMNTYCRLTRHHRETLANIRIFLIFLQTKVIGLNFAADSMDLSLFIFLMSSVNFIMQE